MGGKPRLTKEEFIKKSKVLHGELYDYSKVEYTNSKTKVVIIDPIFGEFSQTPCNHMKGHGCKKRTSFFTSKNKNSLLKFIEKAKEIHGDLYDYSKVIYKNCDTKVTIIDPEYGEFKQSPYSHINLKRGHVKRRKISEDIIEERKNRFIKKSIEKFGEIHDFSEFIFLGKKYETSFYDKVYGTYRTKPDNHLIYNSIHPQRKINEYKIHELEKDHIIPISILCSAKERGQSFFRNRPLYKLLNSSINFSIIDTTKNRIKNDNIEYDKKIISARKIRNDYNAIKKLLIEKLNLSIEEIDLIIENDKKYMES